jgi:hypothetical protein
MRRRRSITNIKKIIREREETLKYEVNEGQM